MALRRFGVTDPAVLGALERVPRHIFVPDSFSDQAWNDTALPIGYGQTISQPTVVGLMTQALEVTDRHKVLEIGTGSGYQAAVLSRLARRVYSIERHAPLLTEAQGRFERLRYTNITARRGDGTLGWPEQAPFDRIIVTAAGAGDPPSALIDQLSPEGILVIPLGPSPTDQEVVKIRKTADGLDWSGLFPVRFVPLISDAKPEES